VVTEIECCTAAVTKILLVAEDGVIATDSPVTSVNEVLVVVKAFVLVVLNTCNTLPKLDEAVVKIVPVFVGKVSV
jgi:hypothetical protein